LRSSSGRFGDRRAFGVFPSIVTVDASVVYVLLGAAGSLAALADFVADDAHFGLPLNPEEAFVARPTLGTAPTAEELLAMSCVDRYVAISRLARTTGTLPRVLHRLRLAALSEALAHPDLTATALAARAEQSLGRVSQLYKLARLTAGQES
jgi:hypothetical protein